MTRYFGFPLMIVLIAGAAGYGARTPRPFLGSASAAQERATSVTVDMEDIRFDPNEFTIPANTAVKVTLDNKGALPHNFSITDHMNLDVKNLNISVTLQPGKSQTITINAPAGNYYYYCDEPGHEAAGMFGTMHVVATAEHRSNPVATPVAIGAGEDVALAPTVAALATTVAQLTTRVAALETAVASGNQVAATSPATQGGQTVSGAGTMVSEKFYLEPGRYKVMATLNVTSDLTGFIARLYGPNGSENALFNTFIRQSGTWTGSTITTVDTAGDYFVVVSNTESSWTLTFEPF